MNPPTTAPGRRRPRPAAGDPADRGPGWRQPPVPSGPTSTPCTLGRDRGRPPAFDRDAYHQRNVIERCSNRLEQNWTLATRYAERAALYRAPSVIAAIRIRLK